jgi:hypothetical protein
MAFKNAGTPTPFGDTTPMPVTTTRLFILSVYLFNNSRKHTVGHQFAGAVQHLHITFQLPKTEVLLFRYTVTFCPGSTILKNDTSVDVKQGEQIVILAKFNSVSFSIKNIPITTRPICAIISVIITPGVMGLPAK